MMDKELRDTNLFDLFLLFYSVETPNFTGLFSGTLQGTRMHYPSDIPSRRSLSLHPAPLLVRLSVVAYELLLHVLKHIVLE